MNFSGHGEAGKKEEDNSRPPSSWPVKYFRSSRKGIVRITASANPQPPLLCYPSSFRMRAPLTKLSAVTGLCLLLASCAQTGPPLPPSLELPNPPSDLRAGRKGNRVTLTWSESLLTTDRQAVRYLGPTLICRSRETEMTSCGNAVQMVEPEPGTVQQKPPRKSSQKSQPAPTTPRTYTDTLSASAQSENPDAEVTYAVEVLNRNARGAGLSNRIHVPAISTLPAPGDLADTLTGDGVLLNWTSTGEPSAKAGAQYRYRIYRRNEGAGQNKGKDTIVGEVPVGSAGPSHFMDAIEWENTYQYWITAVTIISRPGREVQIEGDDSPVVRVIAHDVFPPSVPAGLQAAYSGEGQKPFIDLIWAPVASADLAGYNIYRSEANGAVIKLNSELVKTPSYRDSAVGSGKTYTYSVSAVDARGNESARSDAASETVP